MGSQVSIIVPVYKVEKYLNRCVESIVNQTYQDLEIILVDDGSPDNCPQICDSWAEKDERIRVVHKENAGLGMARNSGLEIATGDYLMFVDSDDYLSENAVKSLYGRIIQDGTDMAIGKHVDVYEDGKQDDLFCRWMKDEVITRDTMLMRMGETNRFSVMACMKMYKCEVFQNLRFPKLLCGEDCYLFPSVVDQCEKISVVNELVYYYYQRSTSILHQMTDKRLLDDIIANLKLARYLQEKGFEQAAKKWYAVSIDKATRMGNKKRIRMVLEKAFTQEERNRLLKGLDKKTVLKWIGLYVPVLLPVMRNISQKIRR